MLRICFLIGMLAAVFSTGSAENTTTIDITKQVIDQASADSHEAGATDATQRAIEKASAYTHKPINLDSETRLNASEDSRKAIEKIENNPIVLPAVPDLFSNITSPPINIEKLGQDISKMSQDGLGLVSGQKDKPHYESQILLFASSSMPNKVMQSYIRQTARIDAAVVLRGLINDSMTDTREYLLPLVEAAKQTDIKAEQLKILIDPTLFKRFNIEQVPTIVVTESQIQPCQPDGCPTPVYHTVSGDVSLRYAVELIARQVDSKRLKQALRPVIKDM